MDELNKPLDVDITEAIVKQRNQELDEEYFAILGDIPANSKSSESSAWLWLIGFVLLAIAFAVIFVRGL